MRINEILLFSPKNAAGKKNLRKMKINVPSYSTTVKIRQYSWLEAYPDKMN